MGEFSHQEALLKSSLPMAVMLNILNFKNRPWSELQEIATYASQYVAEKGDNILFKSQKKGDTAKAFNELAKGVAVLAFAPGGVTIFGQHYEATHPDSLTGTGRWLYHTTFAVDLPNIAKNGLEPQEKGPESVYPKLYLTGIIGQAVRYIDYAFSSLGFISAGDPVLLRIHSAHLGDVHQAESPTDDWYIERTIPAIFIQVWVPEKKAWIEVREAVDQGYIAPDRRTYGNTREELLSYIQESWPTI